ncbi:PQQ-binding-like beta-propeller repeat protein [Krasilnikovia sp. MM14-A1004]|uniref:outer membrane protein assembly factor BamB family protein n=1 Tax=Krasilnikovia sp. MM14-A1004 TaxID=3373541 RepID=UPI00399C5C8D
MAVIELGYVGSGGDELPDPAPLRPADWGRRHVRRLTAALLVALCLVTATASDHLPAPRGLRAQWEILFFQGDTFATTRDRVVVLSEGATQRLAGYDLVRGTQLWSRELAHPAPFIMAAAGSEIVLLPSGERSLPTTPGAADRQSFFAETVAVDAATGAELWRAPGDVTATSLAYLPGESEHLLMVDHATDSAAAVGVRLVNGRDGRTLWSRATPGALQVATIGPDPWRPDRVATVTASGQVRLLRLADGAELGGGTIAEPAVPGSNAFLGLEWHGQQLTVMQSTNTGLTATGYGGQPLRQRWRVRDADAVAAYGCGPVWCMSTGAALVGRDWDTGLERWRVRSSNYTRSIGDHLLAVDGTEGSKYTVIDAQDGRTVAALDGEPVMDDTGAAVLALSRTVSPGGRTAVGRVDLRTGETFHLGTIDGTSDYGCRVQRNLLVCQSVHDRLTVTAVG